jgi:hypothetical protein
MHLHDTLIRSGGKGYRSGSVLARYCNYRSWTGRDRKVAVDFWATARAARAEGNAGAGGWPRGVAFALEQAADDVQAVDHTLSGYLAGVLQASGTASSPVISRRIAVAS